MQLSDPMIDDDIRNHTSKIVSVSCSGHLNFIPKFWQTESYGQFYLVGHSMSSS